MKKQTKLLIAIIALLVICGIFWGISRKNAPTPTEGSKGYTVEVVNSKGESKTYEARTDAEFLREALEELSETQDFTMDGEESEYGLMITSINGEEAVYEKDNAYWAIYVNDEYGQYGVDQQPVEDQDAYKFVYENAE